MLCLSVCLSVCVFVCSCVCTCTRVCMSDINIISYECSTLVSFESQERHHHSTLLIVQSMVIECMYTYTFLLSLVSTSNNSLAIFLFHFPFFIFSTLNLPIVIIFQTRIVLSSKISQWSYRIRENIYINVIYFFFLRSS